MEICRFAFVDWHTEEICGFAIAEQDQEFTDLRFASLKICLLTSLYYAVVDLLVVSSRYIVAQSTLMMIHLHT
jgi:hypothetical protein